MAYQVIARKWRPQSFEDVVGQEPIMQTLANALNYDRLAHAYLFSGARGVGKTTSARLLAKGINCNSSPTPTSKICNAKSGDVCISCEEISAGMSTDVIEIDAATHSGVDDVKDNILSSVNFSPTRDRYRIFIIDEVHMLSTAAFNALLKTLEEPQERVIFILATTDPQKLPKTILSRCQKFQFKLISITKIFERLKLIAGAEGIIASDIALKEIARAGEGSMRDAQSAMDQVISYAGDMINPQDVEICLGIAGAETLTAVMEAIVANTPIGAINIIDDIVQRGQDLKTFCREIMSHIRDLTMVKMSGDPELLESSACDFTELQRQAALFSGSDLIRFFHSLTDTEVKMNKAARPRYIMEIGLVKLTEMRRLAPLSNVLERLAEIEAKLNSPCS